MSKKIKILMTVSVILNLILAGWIVGQVMRPHGPWHHGPDKMVQELPPQLRKEVEAVFEASHEKAKGVFEAMMAAKAELRGALSAETFDVQAYNNASRKLNELKAQMMALKADKTREIASRLSAIDRRKLAGHLMRSGRGGCERGRGGPPSAEGPAVEEFPVAPQKFDGEADPAMVPIPE